MAHAIRERLDAEHAQLLRQWQRSAPISHFVLDDVLPEQWVTRIRSANSGDEASSDCGCHRRRRLLPPYVRLTGTSDD